MRAAVMSEYKKPFVFQELPDPRPKAGQVVLKVEASAMCRTDLHIHQGLMPMIRNFPVVMGHEPVGKVVEVGEGVTNLKVGDRVGVQWNQKGCGRCKGCLSRASYCLQGSQSWAELGGGNAELMLAWADGCTLVPEGVSADDAAPMFCAGFTVMSAIRAAAPQPGERVAVLGVGGLGHIALQILRAFGLETVAMTSTAGKKDESKGFGADHVVVTGDHAGKALQEIGGADVVISTSTSAAQIVQTLGAVRRGGRLVTLGALDAPLSIPMPTIMFPPKSIIGAMPSERRNLVNVLEMVAAGKVKPVTESYPLDKANDVMQRLDEGKVRYRAVLHP